MTCQTLRIEVLTALRLNVVTSDCILQSFNFFLRSTHSKIDAMANNLSRFEKLQLSPLAGLSSWFHPAIRRLQSDGVYPLS